MRTGAAIIAETDGSYSLRRASLAGHGDVVLTNVPSEKLHSKALWAIVARSSSVIEDSIALLDRLTLGRPS